MHDKHRASDEYDIINSSALEIIDIAPRNAEVLISGNVERRCRDDAQDARLMSSAHSTDRLKPIAAHDLPNPRAKYAYHLLLLALLPGGIFQSQDTNHTHTIHR